MISAMAVAAYIVQKAESLGAGNPEFSGNNDVTNLKLQKLLYFAQVEHMKKYNKPLFDDEIEAWQYGPVIRVVYNTLKHCGAYFITDFDLDLSEAEKVDPETRQFLDKFCEKYLKYSAWALVNKTHQPGSAWDNIYQNGKGDKHIIPKDSLKTTATM